MGRDVSVERDVTGRAGKTSREMDVKWFSKLKAELSKNLIEKEVVTQKQARQTK